MRMMALRLREGEDVKDAVETFVRSKNIHAATVISAVGSLRRVRIRMAGAAPDAQDIRDYKGAFEIVSLIGNISNSEGEVLGGHVKEGCIAHTTVELVLAVDDALEFQEEIDPATGFGELKIKEK